MWVDFIMAVSFAFLAAAAHHAKAEFLSGVAFATFCQSVANYHRDLRQHREMQKEIEKMKRS